VSKFPYQPYSEANAIAMLKEEEKGNRKVCKLLGLCPECGEDLCSSFSADRPAVYRCMACAWEEGIVTCFKEPAT